MNGGEPDLFRVMEAGPPAGAPSTLPRAPECTPRLQIQRRRRSDLAPVARFAEVRRALARAVQGVTR